MNKNIELIYTIKSVYLKNMIVRWFLCLSLCLSTVICVAQSSFERIPTGAGPEDIVLDTFSNKETPRLIVSCSSRRKGDTPFQEIMSIDIATNVLKTLVRKEPVPICFHPHGIDLVKGKEGLVLYVANHCDAQKLQRIVKYKVEKDTLIWLSSTSSPLITSPNAVCGRADGRFLVSNDSYKRGSIAEMLFKQKKCRTALCQYGSCSEVGERIAYGNGIMIDGNKVYQASTMPGAVYVYDFTEGKLQNQQLLTKVPGADNIRDFGDEIIVAGHTKFGKFLKHMKNAKRHSPTLIVAINKKTGQQRILFEDDGARISAASTALVFDGYLYISQIFDAFLGKVKLD